MKEEQWLKKITERLDDYSEEIPSDGWQRLEKALGEVGATPFRQEEKRAKVIPLRRWLAVAASVTLVVAGSLSLWLLNGPADERMRLAQTPVELTEEPVIEEPAPLPRAEEEDTRLAVAIPLSRPAIVHMDEKEEETQTDAPRTENNRTVAPDTSRTDEVDRPKRKTSLEADIPMTYESKRTRKGWSFGMAVGGRGMASDGTGGASFVKSNDMTGSLSSSNINLSAMADGVITIPNGQALAFKAGKPYLMARERVLTSADHHQPVSAGFSVRKELGKRGIRHLKVVYSQEEAMTPQGWEEEAAALGKRQIPGSMSYVPGAAGLILAVLSLLTAAGYFIYKLLYWDTFQLGLAPLVIGLFFFSAVQLVFIGVIGEYIGAIWTQVKNRPLAIEEEKINFNVEEGHAAQDNPKEKH